MSSERLRKWIWTALIICAVYVLETSLLPWLMPAGWRSPSLSVYPKLVLVCVVYISVLANRHAGAGFALAFGALQDLMFYGHMIGVNAFTYALSAYAAGLLARPNSPRLSITVLIQFASLLLYEISSYALYRLFSIIEMDFQWIFLRGMLPSMLISLFFALAIFVPARRWMERPRSERDADGESQ